MNIANFLRTAILKNIWERLLLYLMDFSEQLVFREAIFQKSFLKVSSLKLSYFSSYSQIKLFVQINTENLLFTFTQKKILQKFLSSNE